MDTLAQNPNLRSDGGAPMQFLPPESPMAMSKQPLHGFETRQDSQKPDWASVAPRRVCIFAGTAALTIAGCYEMYEVLEVGGVTTLEWMVLSLFVLLFAWIAFSFMSALAASRYSFSAAGMHSA
jgi:membrane glycosyltransferase